MGIIGTCVSGTLLATFVLFLHSRKIQCRPLPRPLLRLILLRKWLWALVLEPPANLKELWVEYGLLPGAEPEEEGQVGDNPIHSNVPKRSRHHLAIS